ncbi:unnamed protein product [Blepharisma stoltei]|uniref:Uncharacterized protein n=1 Tax=Blepharisma stoltei TaxID=1481888 RepID=A0AAU9JGM7_9CILI|nr:unnamed protein product [Blepharisma stoltei]
MRFQPSMILEQSERLSRISEGASLPSHLISQAPSSFKSKVVDLLSRLWNFLLPKSEINSITRSSSLFESLKGVKSIDSFNETITSEDELVINDVQLEDNRYKEIYDQKWSDKNEPCKRKKKIFNDLPAKKRKIAEDKSIKNSIKKDESIEVNFDVNTPSWEKFKIPKEVLPSYKRAILAAYTKQNPCINAIFSKNFELGFPGKVFKTIDMSNESLDISQNTDLTENKINFNISDDQSVALSDDSLIATPSDSPKPSPRISPRISPAQSPKNSPLLLPQSNSNKNVTPEKAKNPNLELESPIAIRAEAPKMWGRGNSKIIETAQSPQFGIFLKETEEPRNKTSDFLSGISETIAEEDEKQENKTESMEISNVKHDETREIKELSLPPSIAIQGNKPISLLQISSEEAKKENPAFVNPEINPSQNPFLNPNVVVGAKSHFVFGSSSAAPPSYKNPFQAPQLSVAATTNHAPAEDIDMKDSPKLQPLSSPKLQQAPFPMFSSPTYTSPALFSSPPFPVPNQIQSPPFPVTPTFSQSPQFPTSPASSTINLPFNPPFVGTNSFMPSIGSSTGSTGGFSLGILPEGKRSSRRK